MKLRFDINDEPTWIPSGGDPVWGPKLEPCPATNASEEPHLRCWLEEGHDGDHHDIEHGLTF